MKYNDPCEYNPNSKESAYEDETHAQADIMVGYKCEWRICKSCAAVPEFKKYRVRKKIQK